jgi:tol-pal system protein YbgF
MRFFPILLVFLFVAGCVSTEEVTNIKTDVDSVYKEYAADRQQKNERLTKIDQDIDALRKQLLDVSISLEAKEDKLKTVLGKLDELESQMRTYWEETKAELRAVKKGRDQVQSTPKGPAGEDQYKDAFDLLQKGSYQESIVRFSDFVKGAPDNPLVPNAYYWMGEANMSLKDYEKAIVDFQEVIDKYPSSDKASRSLLRQAEAFSVLGDKKSSTTLIKRVIELYPKSEEARLAERLLRNAGLQ